MIVEKNEEKHQILECFEEQVTETYEVGNGKKKEAVIVVPQWINQHGIKIRRGCMSCQYGHIAAKEGTHTCEITGETTAFGHHCNKWNPKELYQKAGSAELATGEVQTAEYVRWKVANYSTIQKEYTDRLQSGMRACGLEVYLRERYTAETGKGVYYNKK